MHGSMRGLILGLASLGALVWGGVAMAQSTTILVPVTPPQYRASSPAPQGSPTVTLPQGLKCGVSGTATVTYPNATVVQQQLDNIDQVNSVTVTQQVVPAPYTVTSYQFRTEQHTVTNVVTHTSNEQVMVAPARTVTDVTTHTTIHPAVVTTQTETVPVEGQIPHTTWVDTSHWGSKTVWVNTSHNTQVWVNTSHNVSETVEAEVCSKTWVPPHTIVYSGLPTSRGGDTRRDVPVPGHWTTSCHMQLKTITAHITSGYYKTVWVTSGYDKTESVWVTSGYDKTTYTTGGVGHTTKTVTHTTPAYKTYTTSTSTHVIPATYKTVTTLTTSTSTSVVGEVISVPEINTVHPSPYNVTHVDTTTEVQGQTWNVIGTETVGGTYKTTTTVQGLCPVPTA